MEVRAPATIRIPNKYIKETTIKISVIICMSVIPESTNTNEKTKIMF